MYKQMKHLAVLAAALGAVALVSGPAAAQELDRLQVHGYLTQGYATTTEGLPFLGIDDEATADYRTAAIQFNYLIADKSTAVIQFSHRRLGTSVLTNGESDVSLDWAFLRQRLGPVTAKVGKIPMPSGIYNETRDVGTLLPFYRAPAAFYAEGFETMDGVSLTGELPVGGWSVEGTAFGGGFDYRSVSVTPTASTVSAFRVDRAFGAQAWINTPVPGVRFGGSAMRFQMPERGTSPEYWASSVNGSVDATLDRVYGRAEIKHLVLSEINYENNIYYGQVGARVHGGLSVNVQGERSHVVVERETGDLDYDALEDVAVGVNYAFNPNIVLKLEGHSAKGTAFDTFVNPAGPAGESKYVITSLSVSF
jgi:hypothetical protein